jgi:hypothetical protein
METRREEKGATVGLPNRAFRTAGQASSGTNALVMATWLLVALSCWAAEPVKPIDGNGSDAAAGCTAVETVRMRDGRTYAGLIESEEETSVNLIEIRRPRGQPMFLVIRPLDQAAIASIDRLPAAEREKLQQQIEQFIHRARIEQRRADAVQLQAYQKAGITYQHFAGRWFELDSTVDEPTTRRIVVRVEQAFTGYRQLLPPRHEPSRPLRLIVFGSLAEYQEYLRGLNLPLEQRACYLRGQNLVLAASELALYSAELAQVGAAHDRLRNELATLQNKLAARLHEFSQHLQQSGVSSAEVTRLLNLEKQKNNREFADKQKQLQTYDRQNGRHFAQLTAQLFQQLDHEAMHAYLENYVYPHDQYDVPFWLNEGLAVMVEGGQWEGGVLRIDAPNREALRRLQADLAAQHPLSLSELLCADQQAFLSKHHTDAEPSQRYYAAAWGLVYYLTYQRNLLDEKQLDRYVRPRGGISPESRFQQWIEQPLSQFESAWRAYVWELK